MLAIRLRVRPCSERWAGSSDDRSTRSVPLSRTTLIWGGTLRSSSPFGPFTCTVPSPRSMVTPLGTGIGILPIRDMRSGASALPDVGQDFAAYLEAARPGATHDALRRRQDGGPETAEHTRDLRRAGIDPQPGLADAFDAHQDRVAAAAARRIAQLDAQHFVDTLAALFERIDVALIAQHFGNRPFHLGKRHVAARVPSQRRVADARQHVRDRIAHRHRTTSSPW